MTKAYGREAWRGEDGGGPFASSLEGTPGDDRLRGNIGDNAFDVSQGGDDTVQGRGGDDTVYFGAAFTGADTVNGGTGFDVVTLDGDYSTGVEVQADSFLKIERLILEGGAYAMTGELNFADDFNSTIVDARGLTASQPLMLDVASLGNLYVNAGAGDDVLHASRSGTYSQLVGFDGDDTLIGGSGPSLLAGLAGADRIVMGNADDVATYGAGDSTAKAHDTIENFAASGGRIQLYLDSDTTTPERDHDYHLGKTADRVGDIVFKYDAAADETILKVFTDHDKAADLIVHLTGNVPLTTADFIFG